MAISGLIPAFSTEGDAKQTSGSGSRVDLTDIYCLTSPLFDCTNTYDLRKQVLALLQSIFKADSANFFLVTNRESRVSFESAMGSGIDEKRLSDWVGHYHKCDPFRTWDFRYQPACMTEQVTSYRDLTKTRYYNDFLKPQSIYSQLIIYLCSGRNLLGIVGLFRSRKRPVFTPEENEKACLAAPHFARALKMAMTVESNERNQWILDSFASQSDNGIIVLNQSHEIIYINDSAKNILSPFCRTGVRNYKDFSLPDELTRCFLDFCSHEGHNGVFSIGPERGISVLIKGGNLSGKSIYSILLRSDNSTSPSKEFQEFGLTGREFEVASLVCNGYSNAEISQRLHLSKYTVENHLRHIYEKMQVGSRTRLIHTMFSQVCHPHGAQS